MSDQSPRIIRGNFLRNLQHAKSLVPFPWLYFAEIHPLELGETQTEAVAFHRATFVFRVTNEFIASSTFNPFIQERDLVQQTDDGYATLFSAAVLTARNFSFTYRPIQNFQNLISLRAALDRVWQHCFDAEGRSVRSSSATRLFEDFIQRMEKDTLHEKRRHAFEAFEIGPFRSAALAQPFSAEFIEPCYFFRSFYSTDEVVVGACTGNVRLR
jgi:hypothetical protein